MSTDDDQATSEQEQFYDAHVAPVLLRLGRECIDKGISFVAVAEFAPGQSGRTVLLQPDCGFALRLVELSARAEGNVDRLILALLKHAREHGHSSLCLAQLGVPPTPPAPAAQTSRGGVH